MPKSSISSDWDLAIINALEVSPRAELTRVAEALELAPATIARHWDSLVERGQAWVTIAPGPRYLQAGWSAFLSIEVAADQQEELARRLCAEPSFATVLLISGQHQFLVDCFAGSAEESMRLLTEVFPTLPGVRGRRIDPITTVYRQASQWQSGTLEPRARRTLDAAGSVTPEFFLPNRLDAALLHALADDARRSWQETARLTETSPQTAQRRVMKMVNAGYMAFRCDAATLTQRGLREVIVEWMIPVDRIDEVGRRIAVDPMCRVGVQVLGRANFSVTLWVHSYAQVAEHEQTVTTIAPGSSVVERHAVLHTYKRMGQLLEHSGARVGTVPVPWCDSGLPHDINRPG